MSTMPTWFEKETKETLSISELETVEEFMKSNHRTMVKFLVVHQRYCERIFQDQSIFRTGAQSLWMWGIISMTVMAFASTIGSWLALLVGGVLCGVTYKALANLTIFIGDKLRGHREKHREEREETDNDRGDSTDDS